MEEMAFHGLPWRVGHRLPNGGAPEAEIVHRIREWTHTLSGREQLAAQAFADALEGIPLTLASNVGMGPIDTQVDLRATHSKGKTWAGINVSDGTVGDMEKEQVFEPAAVKSPIIKSATEAAIMIHDVSASKEMGREGGGPLLAACRRAPFTFSLVCLRAPAGFPSPLST
jgi:chaperonin GroEL (HSP60 family)